MSDDVKNWAYTAKCVHGQTVAFDAFDDEPAESQRYVVEWINRGLTVQVETANVSAGVCASCTPTPSQKYWERATLAELARDLDDFDDVPVGVLSALKRLLREVNGLIIRSNWGAEP